MTSTTAIVYSDEWRHFDYGREHRSAWSGSG